MQPGGAPRQMSPQQAMMMKQLQQLHMKIKSENPDMPEEQIRQVVMQKH